MKGYYYSDVGEAVEMTDGSQETDAFYDGPFTPPIREIHLFLLTDK